MRGHCGGTEVHHTFLLAPGFSRRAADAASARLLAAPSSPVNRRAFRGITGSSIAANAAPSGGGRPPKSVTDRRAILSWGVMLSICKSFFSLDTLILFFPSHLCTLYCHLHSSSATSLPCSDLSRPLRPCVPSRRGAEAEHVKSRRPPPGPLDLHTMLPPRRRAPTTAAMAFHRFRCRTHVQCRPGGRCSTRGPRPEHPP